LDETLLQVAPARHIYRAEDLLFGGPVQGSYAAVGRRPKMAHGGILWEVIESADPVC